MLGPPFSLLDEAFRAFAGAMPSLSTLAPLDYLALLVLGIFGLDGLRRGLILGALDVAALAATLTIAVSAYPLVGTAVSERLPLPGALANVVAFAAIFLAGQLAYALAASLLRGLLKPLFAVARPLSLFDVVGGVLPGFVKGAIVIGILASAVRGLPMASDLKQLFERSQVVQRTAPIGTTIVPDLPALLGRLGLDQIVVAPPPQASGSPQQAVRFPPNLRLEADPASEARMLQLVNAERANNGLQPLVLDPRLVGAARAHSEEMFRLSYFAHDSPVAGSPFDRMQRAGVRFDLAGENLAYAPDVDSAHRGLMNSPEHRRNILTPGFRHVGIGIVSAGSWGRMFTQNFTD